MSDHTDYDGIVQRLRAWCSRRDRSCYEAEARLRSFGLSDRQVDRALDQLLEEKFLDDDRFTESFISGHFRIKGWGRKKMMVALRQHRIPQTVVTSALAQLINEEEYRETLIRTLKRKGWRPQDNTDFEQEQKLLRYAYQRGFEPELIRKVIASENDSN